MKNATLIKVVLAIFAAIFAGLLSSPQQTFLGISPVDIYDLIGQLFLNALTLVVVPLVAASIISGAARMGSEANIGNLGLKTLFYFLLTSTLAVLVGYGVAMLMQPGAAELPLKASSSVQQVVELATQGSGFAKLKHIALKIIPSNILAAAAEGQMLGLLFFCLLFGYFTTKIEPRLSASMLSFWQALFQVMMKITQFVMRALPLGVFGLVAKVVATAGADALQSAAYFFASVLIALAIYMSIVLPLVLKCAGLNPLAHYRAMLPALITAFSTSSSAASLPIAIECMERRAAVSNRICSFALPLGTSVTAGSALYACMTVFFIAKLYHVPLSASSQSVVIAMAVLTSIGMAGIPSASLIAIVVILQTIGLPAEGIGAVLAVERFLDMFRTAANLFSNSCCTLLLAKSEGEKGLLGPMLSNQDALKENMP